MRLRRRDLWVRRQPARRRWWHRSMGVNDTTGAGRYTADLACGCHWYPARGPVVMVGRERHD